MEIVSTSYLPIGEVEIVFFNSKSECPLLSHFCRGDRKMLFNSQALLKPLLTHLLSFFGGGGRLTAYGISVPRPGIKPVPPAVEAWSPNYWTAREFPHLLS